MLEKYIKDFSEKGIASLSKLSTDEQRFVVNWAQDVVDQYGSALKEHPMKIKNIDDLPFPKEEIKVAIKTLITAYAAKDSKGILAMLKDQYVRLSTFQKLNQEDKDTTIKEAAEMNSTSDLSGTSLFPTYQKYMQLVISEQKVLLEDINTFLDNP
jgi:hypothetical protein